MKRFVRRVLFLCAMSSILVVVGCRDGSTTAKAASGCERLRSDVNLYKQAIGSKQPLTFSVRLAGSGQAYVLMALRTSAGRVILRRHSEGGGFWALIAGSVKYVATDSTVSDDPAMWPRTWWATREPPGDWKEFFSIIFSQSIRSCNRGRGVYDSSHRTLRSKDELFQALQDVQLTVLPTTGAIGGLDAWEKSILLCTDHNLKDTSTCSASK